MLGHPPLTAAPAAAYVPHQYINIDDSLDGLARAKQLTGAKRCTPIVDLAMGGQALVEPSNDLDGRAGRTGHAHAG